MTPEGLENLEPAFQMGDIIFKGEKKKEKEGWIDRKPSRSGPQPQDSDAERNVGDGHAKKKRTPRRT